MAAQQPAVKKFIVKLNADERDRLNALIQKGKAPARQVLKARILLKADASPPVSDPTSGVWPLRGPTNGGNPRVFRCEPILWC